jgi:hypothetical protein
MHLVQLLLTLAWTTTGGTFHQAISLSARGVDRNGLAAVHCIHSVAGGWVFGKESAEE